MPNFVAIELNENVMVVACAKGTGKNFQINHLFEIAVADLSSDAERGTALKDALAERSVTKSELIGVVNRCLLYTSPSPRDATLSRMPSSA